MGSPFSDTDAAAEQVHIDLLRRASPARRAQMAFALSARVIALARRALRRANPALPEQEVALLFVASHYGEDLAAGLRSYLAAREQ